MNDSQFAVLMGVLLAIMGNLLVFRAESHPSLLTSVVGGAACMAGMFCVLFGFYLRWRDGK